MNQIFVKVENLILVVLFYIGFIRPVHWNSYVVTKNYAVLLLFVYLIANCNYLNEKYKKIDMAVIFFGFWVALSAFLNRNNVTMFNPIKSSIFFSLALIDVFVVLQIVVEKFGFSTVLRTLRYCSLVTLILTDILAWLNILVIYGQGLPLYLIGTKFSVMYQHLIFLSLWLFEDDYNYKSPWMIPYILLCVLMGIKVDCVTGLVGIVLFWLFWWLIKSIPKIMYTPLAALIAEGLAFAYVYAGMFLMNTPAIYNFIENRMGGAETMMARVQIYEIALAVVSRVPILGLGYYTTYELGTAIGGFANTQNSLLDWIWQAGIPGALMICVIMALVFSSVKKQYRVYNLGCPGIVALFFVYVMLGSVEILFEIPFFMIVSMVMVSSNRSKDLMGTGDT